MELEFFEKPGCKNNTKQKKWLEGAECRLEVHDLLAYPFAADELAHFFRGRPRSDWFNQTAPRLKSGEFNPEGLSDTEVFEAMLKDRLLIKRPLIRRGQVRLVGWDAAQLAALGINGLAEAEAEEMSACKEHKPCPQP
ncbi:MAG: ArsC/Spx/MgsR family protein [bacterium]|nr:ArsC/Spx/MgsR family protein [bacterium]